MISTAFVKIWGNIAGAVAWDEQTRTASFEFDSKFFAKNIELSPLKMPVNSNRRIFSFPELRESVSFKGLPGLLADSLPDRYGKQLINAWLVQNKRSENSMNPVELLCFIGTRGMGALEFEPSYFKPSKKTFNIEIDGLVDIATKMLEKRNAFETNLRDNEQKAIQEILKIGTSAGGARPKAIIAYNQKTGQVKSGQTKAPEGFEHWLIKLDGVSDVQFGESSDYGRIEMAYYRMAKECAIDMMESRLLTENNRAHFMTKRFDREGCEKKNHIQTFCALQHYDYYDVHSFSYEQLFQTMRQLHLPYTQAEQMFRRMIFNVMANNCDDHTKNFAFRLKEGENWELTPAYDICYAYRPESEWVSQHALSINGKRKNITKDDMMAMAKMNNIRKADTIIRQIESVVARWPDFADETNVNPVKRDAIQKTLVALNENLKT